ncbi:MAG: DUF1415 family protein [Bacteroidetes bacterium]|nr:MAG: DUF1415 family protein [Bacteroidota bacterium]
MLSEEKIAETIATTKKWVETIIIGLNLCPFAKSPFQHNKIRFSVIDAKNINGFLELFVKELELMEQDETIETTLLILPALGNITEHFLPYFQLCEKTIVFNQAQKKFQLVSFHPFARFTGIPANSARNLIAMAPYPIVHILRTPSVENLGAAMKKDVQTENDKRLKKMSQTEVQALWKKIEE